MPDTIVIISGCMILPQLWTYVRMELTFEFATTTLYEIPQVPSGGGQDYHEEPSSKPQV
jgi:hypothetical protein